MAYRGEDGAIHGPLTPEQKRAQGLLFGRELKERALNKAEAEHENDLQAARLIRDRLAIEHGEVDADMVRTVFESYGRMTWGPWAGALFRGKDYVPTGVFKPSVFATNHGAVIRVWRRKA